MTPDSITIDSITRCIYTLLVAIKSEYPGWLKDKYSHYEWESEKVRGKFRAKFKSKLEETTDRDTLVMEIMKVLHLFLVPSFFLSPEFAQLLADIRHYIHPTVTHPSMDGGIAILLLDAENLQLDVATEQFLTSICSYPIQIKVAFANWRSLGKKDLEFHGRGYELIHVPPGKDSADVKMATVGSSIFVHYPTAKEVFVCSSDGVMTHLCTTLQTHGLSVYLVRKQKEQITVLNTQTGNTINHSTLPTPSIPTPINFIKQLQNIILEEQKATGNSWIKLARISELFQQQHGITISQVVAQHLPGKKVRDMLSNYPDKLVIHEPTAESGIYVTLFHEGKEGKSAQNNPLESQVADESQLPNAIETEADLEQAITIILGNLTAESNQTDISIANVAAKFMKQYGKSITETMKRLKLSGNFSKFLQSHANFQVTKNHVRRRRL